MVKESVVLLHSDSGECTETVFDDVLVKHIQSCGRQGINHSGIIDTSKLSVRIFTEKELNVGCGDRLLLKTRGNMSEFTVCEISDNRVGTKPHYRILGER